MFLPWVQLGYSSASYVDVMSGKTTIRVGWLTAGLLAFGALAAAVAAASRLLRPAPGRGSAQVAAVGFAATLGGFGLWFVLWNQVDQAYGWLGVQMGIGELAGIAAAVVGLVAAIVDFRSQPSPLLAPPQAGQWSAPAGAPQIPPPWPGFGDTQQVPFAGPGPSALGVGHISWVEGGQPGKLIANVGEQISVGRDPGSRIRLTDSRASRKHTMIAWSGADWVVRDMNATNPTRLLGASGSTQVLTGEMRLVSGQLLIGEALLTLFPAGS
jgi:hypothetical protein